MPNRQQIWNLVIFMILSTSLIRGTVITDTFYLRGNQFNLTYSNLKRLETSSKSECCIQCIGGEACFAVVLDKALNFCLILLVKNESGEMHQIIPVQPDSDIWFKHGYHGEMKFTTSPATEAIMEVAAATTATSIEAFVEATTTAPTASTSEATAATPTTDCTEVFSCPPDFIKTCEGCLYFGGSVVEWEAASLECSTMGQGVRLALTSTPEKLNAVVNLMDSLDIESAWTGAKDELSDPHFRDVFYNYDLWENGQVDNSDGNCAVIYKHVGLLSLDQCADSHLFVCEADPEV